MNKKLVIFINIFTVLISVLVFADMQRVFVLELNYNKGEVKENNLYVTPIFYNEKKDQPENRYLLKLISDQNEELFKLKFDFSLEVFDIPGIYSLDQGNFTFYIPYSKNAKNVEIYNPNGKKILDINVEKFVKNVCGDLVCDSEENYQKCSLDCPNPIKIKEKSSNNLLYLLFLIILISLLLLYLYKRKNL